MALSAKKAPEGVEREENRNECRNRAWMDLK